MRPIFGVFVPLAHGKFSAPIGGQKRPMGANAPMLVNGHTRTEATHHCHCWSVLELLPMTATIYFFCAQCPRFPKIFFSKNKVWCVPQSFFAVCGHLYASDEVPCRAMRSPPLSTCLPCMSTCRKRYRNAIWIPGGGGEVFGRVGPPLCLGSCDYALLLVIFPIMVEVLHPMRLIINDIGKLMSDKCDFNRTR